LILLLFDACQLSEEKADTPIKDLIITVDSFDVPSIDTTVKTRFTIVHLNDSIKKQFQKQDTALQLKIIGALNRMDVRRLGSLNSIIIPDTFLNESLFIHLFSKFKYGRFGSFNYFDFLPMSSICGL